MENQVVKNGKETQNPKPGIGVVIWSGKVWGPGLTYIWLARNRGLNLPGGPYKKARFSVTAVSIFHPKAYSSP